MIRICRILDSKFLVIQTPSNMKFSSGKIESVRNLFSSVDLKGVKLVWEVRGKANKPVPASVTELLQDLGMVHCVDLSREHPTVESDTVYTRLFGRGMHNIYQFTDEELREVGAKIGDINPELTAISFHNVRMYKDAARFKIYRKTGGFSSVTGVEGKQSLRKVLMEDAIFPMTKSELVKTQGWKVIDLEENLRVHASKLLETLPDIMFNSVEELLTSLRD